MPAPTNGSILGQPPTARPVPPPVPPLARPAPGGPSPAASSPNGGTGGKGGKTPAAAGHPARRAEVRSGSDVLRLCETIRAHEMGGADAVREKAQEVYRGIIKASNWPFGINKRIAAIRMRRSLRKVANAMELTARSAAAARKTWTDVVGSGTKIGKSSGFDPTR